MTDGMLVICGDELHRTESASFAATVDTVCGLKGATARVYPNHLKWTLPPYQDASLARCEACGIPPAQGDALPLAPPANDMTERFKAAEAHAAKLEAMGREKRTSGRETQAQRFIGRAEGIREALRMLRKTEET